MPKFRPEIFSELIGQTQLPATYSQLVSLARRIETGQIAAGTSRYRALAAPTPSTPASPASPRSTRLCYKCGRPGHVQRDCPAAPSSRVQCYTCREYGHYATSCPTITCRRCGQKGHTAFRCPNPLNNANTEPLGRDRGVGAATS
jgi:hypothetical protein